MDSGTLTTSRPNTAQTSQVGNYLVITPVRDEEAYLRFTIESMIAQSVRPAEWIIVNDGSKDATGKIIDEYAAQHSWIHPFHRPDRGFRKAGGGVVEAFNDGLSSAWSKDWDFLVKLDGDLTLSPDYFEKCLAHFHEESQLGVGGGVICHVLNGETTVEKCPKFHVRGATKIYRRQCWDAIGGFWPAPGWDTMDEVKASMLGWTSRSFPELHLIHHRLTGTAEGTWKGTVKNGRANYVSGYHPLFMISKCLLHLVRRPYVVGSVALFWGFISGYLQRVPQVDDRRTIQFLRREQMKRLLGQKSIWQ